MLDSDESDWRTDVTRLLESVERHQGPDPALQSLVATINDLGTTMSVGITVFVHGRIVTGEAVSGRAFFEGVAERVRLPVGGDSEMTAVVRDGFAERFETLRDSYPTFPQGDESEDSDDSDDSEEQRPSLAATTYLHLKNAYGFVGAQGATIPTNDGLWLRVRLSAVDGFAMGTLLVSSGP